MGTYLSTPVTDKNTESGDALSCPEVPLSWGVVDMQGWRKSMEDAHVAQTDIGIIVEPPGEGGGGGGDGNEQNGNPQKRPQQSTNVVSGQVADAKVFGVFDGHGGPEVARFCQLYLVSVLTQQPTWKALGDSNAQQLSEISAGAAVKPAKQSLVGEALVSTFHALDRMIDDPARRDELIRLRAIKPDPRERQHAANIPPAKTIATKTTNAAPSASSETNHIKSETPEATPAAATTKQPDKPESNADTYSPKDENDNSCESKQPDCKKETTSDSNDSLKKEENDEGANDGNNDNISNPAEDNSKEEDDDSNEAVGKEEALRDQQEMMDEESPVDDIVDVSLEDDQSGSAGNVSSMFQRLLNIGGPAGQVVVDLANAEDGTAESSSAVTDESQSTTQGPSASTPTAIRNGRLICNLPDHAVHAGATAIVAVVVGRTITVANAGDSRAILCRGGSAYPLSFDHKPLQERELSRIRNAGGFVNHFGRVNGNLNLSRSIGDLKYKQVPNIAPPDQIITAEPDIVQIDITDSDEFLILGCDGIWDCLTNEKAVEYVRNRIDTMKPTEIGVQMLNDIISEDPRATQGIGGDNMTIMIIDLQPASRMYRKSASEDESPPS